MNDRAHQGRMIEKYRPYIINLARKLAYKIRLGHLGVEHEDLEQAGYLALLELLGKINWQEMSTKQINSYIRSVLYGRMVDAVRAADDGYRTYGLRGNGKPQFYALEDLPFLEIPGPQCDLAAWVDTIQFINSLSGKTKLIMLYSLQGFTQAEVMKKLAGAGYPRYSPSRISQILKEVLPR